MTGATVGTPAYMSPEQYEGKNIAGAADQYSLGVVAYEMLTGHTPFGGDSIMTIMKGHLMEAPPPIDAERAGLPPQIASTVMRMLEKRIEDRFADMSSVIAALDAKVLPDTHPARTQLIELAKTGVMMRPRMSVPLSPVPAGKSPARASKAAEAATDEHPAPKAKGAKASAKAAAPEKKSNMGLIVGAAAVVLAAAGGGGWYVVSQKAAPAPAPAAEAAPVTAPPPAPVQTTPPVDSAALAAANAPPVTPPPAAEPPKDPKADKKAADAAKKAAAERERKLAEAAAKKAPSAEDELARLRGANAKPLGGQSEVDRLRQAAGAAPVAAPVAAAPAPAPTRAPEPTRSESKSDAGGGTGTIKFQSDEPDAVLEIDGASKGPIGDAVRSVSVKAGSVRWVVKKAGCEPASGTVNVPAGETVTVGRKKASPICGS
jgi:hypothetical protein